MARSKVDGEQRRRMLIRTTSIMLEENGIQGITMRALSARVGISHSAPYRYFSHKTDLLATVAEDGFSRLADQMERLGGFWSGKPLERFRTTVCGYVRFALHNPEVYRLMFGMQPADRTAISPPRNPAERVFSILLSVMREAQARGCFRREAPSSQAGFAWNAVHGLSMLLISGTAGSAFVAGDDGKNRTGGFQEKPSRPPSWERITDRTVEFLVRSFAEPPADADESTPVPDPDATTGIREGDDRP